MRTLLIPAVAIAALAGAGTADAQQRETRMTVDPRGNVPETRQDDDYYSDRRYDDGVYDDRIDDDRLSYPEEAPLAQQAPPPPAGPPRVTFASPSEVVQGARARVTAPPRPVLADAPPPPPPPPAARGDHYRDGYAMAEGAGARYAPPPPHGGPPRPSEHYGEYDDQDYDDRGYEDRAYDYADADMVDYRERYAPPPVVTHTGPGQVTTTTSYSGPGYVEDGYYFPPAVTTTVVVTNGCNC